MPAGIVVASLGMNGLASLISSMDVLKRDAKADNVSPLWAVYSTSSPGRYPERSGKGVAVGPSGVAVRGMALAVEVASGIIAVPDGIQAERVSRLTARVITIQNRFFMGDLAAGFILSFDFAHDP